ncbi:MAG: hypothetical protein ACFB5Z_13185 [Elainellaceae cyanobacterium]
MSLFQKPRPTANPEKLRQLKTWFYKALKLPDNVPLSISQLQCHEPDCPPIETAIAVMSQPPQAYKIHKAVDTITQADVEQAVNS